MRGEIEVDGEAMVEKLIRERRVVLVCFNEGVLENDSFIREGSEFEILKYSCVVILIKKWKICECRDIWIEVRRKDII